MINNFRDDSTASLVAEISHPTFTLDKVPALANYFGAEQATVKSLAEGILKRQQINKNYERNTESNRAISV